jgi:thiosulfate reductase cytochrome b subunit
MTIEATVNSPLAPNAPARPLIHPVWVRVTHWINALAMLVMIGSGWQIYDAAPLFGFTFPRQITLGNWLAGALLWHFAAMWILMVNGVVYLILGILSGRFRRKLFPIYPGEVFHDLFAALRGKLAHDDLSVYNAVQKLLYLGIIVAGITIVLSGLSIWKPVQFHPLTSFFGCHDGDCRLPGRACESCGPRAQKPARDDHRPVKAGRNRWPVSAKPHPASIRSS